MPNPFYNASGSPVTGSPGLSAVMRAEFAAINAGFNLLPNVLTPNYVVVVNPAGTALTVTNSLSGITLGSPLVLPDGSIWNTLGLQHAVGSAVSMPDGALWTNTGLSKLTVLKNQNAATTVTISNSDPGTSAKANLVITTTSAIIEMGMLGLNNPGTPPLFTSEAYLLSTANFNIGVSTAGSLFFTTNNATRMQLDPNGHLGLRRTPDAWPTGNVVFSIGGGGALIGGATTGSIAMYANAYYDGTNYRRINAGERPAIYAVSDGIHVWYNATTGAANSIFTSSEQMRLDVNGMLGVGRVPEAFWNPATIRAVCVGAGGSFYAHMAVPATYVGSNIYYDTGGTYRQIFSVGSSVYSCNQGEHIWLTAPNSGAGSPAALTEKLHMDIPGNLFMRMLPLNWASTSVTLNFGGGSAIGGTTTGAGINVYNNLYYDGSTYRTINGDLGCLLNFSSGQFTWYNAPNGGSNGAVNIREVVRIWPSGAMQLNDIGARNIDGGFAGRMILSGSNGGAIYVYNNTTPHPYDAILVSAPGLSGCVSGSFAGGSLEHYRFQISGTTVGSIVTAGAGTSYLTSSDETQKNFAVPQRDFRAIIKNILVRDGEFIAFPGEYKLLIAAQQLQAAGYGDAVMPPIVRTPEQIAEDTRNGFQQSHLWSADYSKLAPLALWGVQDAYTMLAAIEARLLAAGIP